MPCNPLFSKDGKAVGFVCGPKTKARRCKVAGCRSWATKLCDWPVDDRRTCDLDLCVDHATKVGPDKDYCPRHATDDKIMNDLRARRAVRRLFE